MSRTGAVGAMLAPEGRETGCRESTESSVDTGSGTKGGVTWAFKFSTTRDGRRRAHAHPTSRVAISLPCMRTIDFYSGDGL